MADAINGNRSILVVGGGMSGLTRRSKPPRPDFAYTSSKRSRTSEVGWLG